MDSFDLESGLRSGHGGDFGDGVPGVIDVGDDDDDGASASGAELRLLSFNVLGGSRDGSDVDNNSDDNGDDGGGGRRGGSPVNVEAMADLLLAWEQMRLNIFLFVRGVDEEDAGGAGGRREGRNTAADGRRRGGLRRSLRGSSSGGGGRCASSSAMSWAAAASAARRRMRLRRLRRVGQGQRFSSVVREGGGLDWIEAGLCCFLSVLACAIFFGGVFGLSGVSSLLGL